MLSDALGRRSVDVPDWLNEGFATYMEPNVRVRSSSELYGRTPDLRGMQNLSGTPETIPLFYQKSVSVVAHLIEEYGRENFQRLLDELRKGRAVEAALVSVYGFDDHGLDNSWAGLPIPDPASSTPVHGSRFLHGGDEESDSDRELNSETDASRPASERNQPPAQPTAPIPNRPAPQRNEPSPFVFLDVWILAGVALLAAGAVGVRFVYRRIRRPAEDRGNPWDNWPPDDRYYD